MGLGFIRLLIRGMRMGVGVIRGIVVHSRPLQVPWAAPMGLQESLGSCRISRFIPGQS
jgi:hypothetical protein